MRNLLFRHNDVDKVERNNFRHNISQQHATDSCLDKRFRLTQNGRHPHLYLGLKVHLTGIIGHAQFITRRQNLTFSTDEGALPGHIVQAKDHILRRNNNRLAVGGRKDVVGRHHQHPCLDLTFNGQRQMHSHLVAVKVGIEGGTNQRMQLNGFTFYQDRLKGLYTQSVQRRCTVKHDGVFLDNLLKNVPNLGFFLFHHLFGTFDGGAVTAFFKLVVNERLE